MRTPDGETNDARNQHQPHLTINVHVRILRADSVWPTAYTALDHEGHHWRGGRTISENARLVHRYCNPACDGVEIADDTKDN